METFGNINPISPNQFQEIYTNTGIDIDGQTDIARKAFLPRFKPIVQGMIAFAKSLPGFKDLPLEDQSALLKGGFFCLLVKCCLTYYMLIYAKMNKNNPTRQIQIRHSDHGQFLPNIETGPLAFSIKIFA